MCVFRKLEYQALAASLGAKPAGCTETLTITMVQQLLFISLSTPPFQTPDHHTLTHRTHTTPLHTDTCAIHCEGGSMGEGKGVGGIFLPPTVRAASFKYWLLSSSLFLQVPVGGKKKRKTTTKTGNEGTTNETFFGLGGTGASTRKLPWTVLSPETLGQFSRQGLRETNKFKNPNPKRTPQLFEPTAPT